MTIQISSCLLDHQNVLNNPLMADLDSIMYTQPSRDLLKAPIQTQLRFDQFPCFRQDTNSAVITATKCLVVSLLRLHTSQLTIPSQLTTHNGLVRTNHIGDLRSIATHYQRDRYLVSASLVKLCVAQKHSFVLAVFRGLSYLSLPLLTIRVAFES
jgi:hypothetical protein